MSVPDTHHIAVSTTGQKPTVGGPLETTNVPGLTVEGTDVVPRLANVVVVYGARLGAG